MDDFRRIVEGLLSNSISQTFCLIIATYFALAIVFTMVGTKSLRIRTLVDNAPSILTSLGILGTFTGIFVGLLDFDIRTINKSVPLLLEGLKVAFGTSILGLAGAVAFRILKPVLAQVSVSEDASVKDILESLQTMTVAVETAEKSNIQGFEKLRAALTDDSDSSVSGQLQRMRANLADLEKATVNGFEAQIKEFREFSQHISKAFSEALIEELKAVIREFNEKISEQFGDNFKKLNEAVGRLVEWQENYKQQLKDLKEAFDASVASIQSTQTAVSNIENSTSAISGHMEQFSEINESLQKQLAELYRGLSSLSEMRSKAEEAVPVISEKIESMTNTISEAVNLQKNSVEQVTEAVKSVSNELDQTIKSVGDEINNSLSEQRESHRQMLDGLQSALNETLQNATNQMNDAIGQLDEAMQQEIEGVVRTMAENLSGITQKFVEDYTPLLQQSRKVVEIYREATQ